MEKRTIMSRTMRKQPVWFRENWTGHILYGIPNNFYADKQYENAEHLSGIPDDHFFVDLRGNMKDPESMIGSCTKRVTELFETKEEAIAYYEKEEKKKIEEYKAAIETVEDLVRFCLTHTVSYAEEYTDHTARQAAIEKGCEFFGPDFDMEG